MQTHEVTSITVTGICKKAKINRTTFYANYLDLDDLIDKIEEHMIEDFHELYAEEEQQGYNSNNYTKLFSHIKEHQAFYNTYFKLGLDSHFLPQSYDINLAEKYYQNTYISYHMEYFRAGITALIKLWLKNNCVLAPEELTAILQDEYKNKDIKKQSELHFAPL